MDEYLSGNVEYWSRGYAAESVDHPVFRFYGRILIGDGPTSGRLLDFGCGEGSAVAYFASKGYDAYGVDISETDLASARSRFPALAERFEEIEPKPSRSDRFFGGGFDVITSIQVLYYLDDDDLQERLWSLHEQLADNGVFYATMMGTKSWYWDLSEASSGGMRKVQLPEGRLGGGAQYVNFVGSEEELCAKLPMFEPVHIGFYSEKFRSDEGQGFHFTFVGRKR